MTLSLTALVCGCLLTSLDLIKSLSGIDEDVLIKLPKITDSKGKDYFYVDRDVENIYLTMNYKLSQNNVMIALMLLEKWDKKESYKYLKQSFNYSIFNNIILKLWTLFLLITPSKITKLILSKIIKRN